MGLFHPVVGDRDTGGLFAAAAQDKLVFKACNACESALHPPMAHCRYCGSWDTAWREASGEGRLHAWTVVTHQVHPDYPTPYTVVLVELNDASPPVRMVGSIPGSPELHDGMPMRVCFETLPNGPRVPQWRVAD